MKLSDRYFTIFYLLISFALFVYLCLRAIYAPLVFDEAITFFLYVKTGTYLPGTGFWSANNHFLNSFLSWISYQIGGEEEWVLRLANLLVFPLFAWWWYKLLQTFYSNRIKIIAVLILFGAHYLIEFFAYSRGYGLMITFLTGVLYLLFKYYKNRTITYSILLIIVHFLMVISNLSSLPLSILVSAFFIYLLISQPLARYWKILIAICSLFPLAGGILLSFELKANDQLYYGSEEGFWDVSIRSLQSAFSNTEGGWMDILSLLMILSILIALLMVFLKKDLYRKHIIKTWPAVFALSLMLFYPLNYIVMDVLYPYDRALLYLFPLAILGICILVDVLYKQGKSWPLVLLLPFLAFPISFPGKVSLKSASEFDWSTEQIPDSFYKKVAAANEKMTIGGSYLRKLQWHFLHHHFQDTVYNYQNNLGFKLDYVLVPSSEVKKYHKFYSKVDSNDFPSLYLMKRNNILQKHLIQKDTIAPLNNFSDGIMLYHEKLNDGDRELAFSFEGSLKANAFALPYGMVIQGMDSIGETIYWETIGFTDILRAEDDWQMVNFIWLFDQIPNEVKELKIYLSNGENKTFSLKDASKTLWRINEES